MDTFGKELKHHVQAPYDLHNFLFKGQQKHALKKRGPSFRLKEGSHEFHNSVSELRDTFQRTKIGENKVLSHIASWCANSLYLHDPPIAICRLAYLNFKSG